jgi:hypothetical protein
MTWIWIDFLTTWTFYPTIKVCSLIIHCIVVWLGVWSTRTRIALKNLPNTFAYLDVIQGVLLDNYRLIIVIRCLRE